MRTELTTYWQVYPQDCNPITVRGVPMVHGGNVLAQADKAAAILCRKIVPEELTVLTVGVDSCQFYRGPVSGEILEITASIKSLGDSRLTFEVRILD